MKWLREEGGRFRALVGKWSYHTKENYITAHPSVEWWEGHLNKLVLDDYREILGGVMAVFGCNHGACTILAARNPRAREIVGFDLNREAIRRANRLLVESQEEVATKRKVSFAVTQFSKIKWASDYFDSAIMFHVIEHIYPRDRKRVFTEIRRVMKTGAHLVITLPFEHAYDDGRQHVAFFDVESLTATLVALGLDVRDCHRDQRRDQHTPNGHDCLTAWCTIRK